jgi:HlyD family secretion protein
MATTVFEQQNLEQWMGADPGPAPRARRRLWIWAVGAMVLAAGATVWRVASTPKAAGFQSAAVRRQSIRKSITATGTLQAVTTVQVGTQVSGTISELHADYNSRVKQGQIIARLDPSLFQAQLSQSNATYQSALATAQAAQNNVIAADAAVESARANLDRMQAALEDAQKSYDRTRQLVEAKVGAAMDLQTAQSTLSQAAAQKEQAVAQVNQAKAQAQASRSQVAQAQAQAAQAKASVDTAQVNLDHTVIRAPIDGVVVARNVDVGQTVAASLQAPTVFLIANDLTRMQVLANIDEADVGQLGPDSQVTFTVDAYPADVFRGTIAQVRLAPQTVQNVVTYTAVIDVANPDLKLKPGMTANVTVVTRQRNNVLAVPAAALRFRPEGEPAANSAWPGRGSRVYKIAGKELIPVTVQTGISDGVATEIVSGDLHEGDPVAVAAVPQGAQSGRTPAGRSPFAMGGGRGR